VLAGQDGKILIDSGFATSKPQISEAVNHLSNDPIRHLINTHWHFDHTDGNQWVHEAGATIIGHEKTRNRLSARQEIPEFHGIFPPSPAGARPAIVFSGEKTLQLNGEELRLQYYGAAHTDSDISVRFVRANVLHTGDTWFNGTYPFIDYHNGGSLDGMIAASGQNLRLADNQTIIVPWTWTDWWQGGTCRVRCDASRGARKGVGTEKAGPVRPGNNRSGTFFQF
jgi:glyoxylase-like metal-dependent hydrolase (beta-lactamase superfamily II)